VISAASAGTVEFALLVNPILEDRRQLGQIFAQNNWLLYIAETLEEALIELRNRPVPVVLVERNLTAGNWKDALVAIQQLQDSPLLVVTTRLADEYLWAEALNLGAHDVLAKPFHASELKWVLESAWRISAQKKQQALDSASRRGHVRAS
jgi:DNA-binding response OmpR family regulator